MSYFFCFYYIYKHCFFLTHLDLTITASNSKNTTLINPADTGNVIFTFQLKQMLGLTSTGIPCVNCTRQCKGKLVY